jgi:hypothetical protein
MDPTMMPKLKTHQEEEEEIKKLVDIYISQLNDIEKKVLTIAKEHLETSFSLEKSIGFKQWLKSIKQ